MSSIIRRSGVLALCLTLVAGCAQDRATGPGTESASATSSSKDLLGGVVGTVTGTLHLTSAKGLLRSSPLESDITVQKTIGHEGGSLSIPEAGVTVIVPYGALSDSTVITMTARQGSLVAYDFAPHGITFARPLVFNQRLAGTNATLLGATSLKLGYYSDPSLLGTTTALVSELIGGVSNLLSWSFTAPISHFSGYMVSCRSGE